MVAPYRKVDIRDKTLHKSPPKALQLLKVNEDGKLSVDKDVLKFFHNEEVRDKKVCIVSVAGAMRQGKSFLLNFFLHFLNKKCQKGETKKNWISREGNLQTGFFWETRAERVTEGILIWSEVFLTNIDNEEIAVILMDTQGTFDNELNLTQVTCLFAMSVLLSSVQIFNIKSHIMLNDLHHLQLFAGYAGFQEDNNRPFQKLLVLVRDWCYPCDQPFGEEGGNNLLQNVFAKHEKSNQSEIQQTILGNFSEVGAFLLPLPGEKVMMSINFTGRFNDISSTFLEHVEVLAASLLEPEKLIPKIINGEHMTVGNLPVFINTFLKSFQSGDNPTVKTMFEATCEAQNTKLMKQMKEEYCKLMDNCVSLEQAELIKESILNGFRLKKKMGRDVNFDEMQDQLRKDLETTFCLFYKNKIKPKKFWRKAREFLSIGGRVGTAVGGAARVGALVTTVVAEGASAVGMTQAATAVFGGLALGAGAGVVVGSIALAGFIGYKFIRSKLMKKAPAEEQNSQEGEPAVPTEEKKDEQEQTVTENTQ